MTSITLVRRIAARPAIVFEALTTPEGIRSWWGPDAGPVLIAESDPRVGGQIRVRFRMLDGSEHESRGKYLEIDPPHRLSMSWQWQGMPDGTGVSRIDISLRETPEGTELTFTHSDLPDDAVGESHRRGWSGSLDKLESIYAK